MRLSGSARSIHSLEKLSRKLEKIAIFPSSHHVTPEEVREKALISIRDELEARIAHYKENDLLVELQRIKQRTLYDLEMLGEVGFCKGIENYSRHFSQRQVGDPPPCLLDYFPANFLFFIDESHQTIPQIRAMYNGDRARKQTLIEYGFRLPSAFDNRPLKFDEVYEKMRDVVYVSATPSPWEIQEAGGEIVEQIIRPTGLLDPIITVKKAEGQVDDALEEIRKETEIGGRVLVTTLTKKLSEDLSRYLSEIGVKAKYIHSDIDTIERVQIINDLRKGIFDVLVGINLLREGLDIPEVSLVCILDADKEGFLRSETALIQTCGRAARNVKGRVVMYADKMTNAINRTLDITQKRREIQQEYNRIHNITPHSTKRSDAEDLAKTFGEIADEVLDPSKPATAQNLEKRLEELKKQMKKAAKDLDFEKAASLRDEIRTIEKLLLAEEHL